MDDFKMHGGIFAKVELVRICVEYYVLSLFTLGL